MTTKPRTKYVHFRLPTEIRQRIEVAARLDNRTLSGWIAVATERTANIRELAVEIATGPADTRAKAEHVGAMIPADVYDRLRGESGGTNLSRLLLRSAEEYLKDSATGGA